MSLHIHQEFAPPRSWDQFEELCADIFESAWGDPALVRNGRAGQRQHGVDIVARHGAIYPIGLQCKKRSKWPESRLTTGDIDAEVASAKSFSPRLAKFYLLTTVPQDAALLEHVRHLNEKQAISGSFEVVLLGWEELVRRACLFPNVADKHFGPSGAGASRSPLLATWFLSKGTVELSKSELELAVRELSLDLSDWPAGRVVIRQRESDELLGQLAGFEGRTLNHAERQARVKLRERLRRSSDEERFAERGIRIMLTDGDLSTYLFKVWEDEIGDVVAGFLNNHVTGRDGSRSGPMLRLHWPDRPDDYVSTPMHPAEASAILEKARAHAKRWGKNMVADVGELPAKVRAGVALPRIIRGLMERADSERRSLDELRELGAFELGRWAFTVD